HYAFRRFRHARQALGPVKPFERRIQKSSRRFQIFDAAVEKELSNDGRNAQGASQAVHGNAVVRKEMPDFSWRGHDPIPPALDLWENTSGRSLPCLDRTSTEGRARGEAQSSHGCVDLPHYRDCASRVRCAVRCGNYAKNSEGAVKRQSKVMRQ